MAAIGIESPRTEIELMLARVLQLPRVELFLSRDRVLAAVELKRIQHFVNRRANREPLQYILGSVSFSGLELAVNPHVLIPRPETELLAERAWQFLCALAKATSRPLSALDVGTGSGCLAIAMSVNCPKVDVHAVDISSAAIEVARVNAAKHGRLDHIKFYIGNVFAALPKELKVDLLVANPPYIPTTEIDQLQPEVKDYEPRGALDGGADGLDFFRRLAVESIRFLHPRGRLMVEFGDGQADKLRMLFDSAGWIIQEIQSDYAGRPRILVAAADKS